MNSLLIRGYSTCMAVSDSARPLPPLSGPPQRASLTSEAPRSGFAPADVPRFDEANEASEPRAIGNFAPDSAIDEQIADLERWALGNLARDRREKLRFWVLRGLSFLGAAGAAIAAGFGVGKLAIVLSGFAALAVAVDAAWPSGTFRNPHQRAVYDLRELQNTLKLRWDKVRLAHPDPTARERIAHALALLDSVQSKREEIGKYLGNSEPSPGVQRK
ncbi:MAG TPA: hypothetical protein VHP33_27865 [Polyangiaceae bacterium]|nr:hypothetical protein [Polyangiaceae bacterium]